MTTTTTKGFVILELTPSKTIYSHDGFFKEEKKAKDMVANMPPGHYLVIESWRIENKEPGKRRAPAEKKQPVLNNQDHQEEQNNQDEEDHQDD